MNLLNSLAYFAEYSYFHFNIWLLTLLVFTAIFGVIAWSKWEHFVALMNRAKAGVLLGVLVFFLGLGTVWHNSAKRSYIEHLLEQCGTFECPKHVRYVLERLGVKDDRAKRGYWRD